jgi:hypothetical protein
MHPKLAGFIGTRCNYPAVTTSSYEHRYSDELAVLQALYRYKKCIEITMYYTPLHVFSIVSKALYCPFDFW